MAADKLRYGRMAISSNDVNNENVINGKCMFPTKIKNGWNKTKLNNDVTKRRLGTSVMKGLSQGLHTSVWEERLDKKNCYPQNDYNAFINYRVLWKISSELCNIIYTTGLLISMK